MRGRGLEPRWLITASTSKEHRSEQSKDFARLERHETSVTAPERPIAVACDQNPEAQVPEHDEVVVALAAATDVWRDARDPQTLRRSLLELLRMLDS